MTIIKEIRESCKMSTAELSRRSGVHRRTIYNIETGKHKLIINKQFYRLMESPSKDVDLSYIAGLVDRTSSINITKNKAGATNTSKSPHYMARFIVGSVHPEIPEIIRAKLGIGEVSKRREPSGRIYYNYYAHCQAAGRAVEKILPFLKIKRRKAEVLLEFRKVMEENKLQYQSYLDSGRVIEWDQSIPNEQYEKYYQLISQV